VVEVKSTNGDTHLGGDNIDQRIIDWLIAEFKKEQGIDLRSKGKMALQRLKEAAEKAKIELSTRSWRPRSTCPSSPPTPAGPKHLRKLTRAKLEQMIDDLSSAHRALQEGLADAGKNRVGDRRGGAGRRLRPASPRCRNGEGVLRQGAHIGREPRRSRGHRRGGAGGVLAGEVKDCCCST
jgi:molecular chaperone DnaK